MPGRTSEHIPSRMPQYMQGGLPDRMLKLMLDKLQKGAEDMYMYVYIFIYIYIVYKRGKLLQRVTSPDFAQQWRVLDWCHVDFFLGKIECWTERYPNRIPGRISEYMSGCHVARVGVMRSRYCLRNTDDWACEIPDWPMSQATTPLRLQRHLVTFAQMTI